MREAFRLSLIYEKENVMSLNWTLDRIANYESLCWIEAEKPHMTDMGAYREKEGGGWQRMNPVTESLIWSLNSMGIGTITEANFAECFRRHLLSRAMWGMRATGFALEHEYRRAGVKKEISLMDFKDHIGLSINASRMTDAQFDKAILKRTKDAVAKMARHLSSTDKPSVD